MNSFRKQALFITLFIVLSLTAVMSLVWSNSKFYIVHEIDTPSGVVKLTNGSAELPFCPTEWKAGYFTFSSKSEKPGKVIKLCWRNAGVEIIDEDMDGGFIPQHILEKP